MHLGFRIASTGSFFPETIQTAADLAPLIGKSERWITSRTGVLERRIADEHMDTMAAKAARDALGDGPPPDLIVNASLTPMQLIPDSSVFVQRALGFEGIPSFSIHATCMSFLVAMHAVAGLVQGGAYKRVLVVSSERGSVCRDMDHPESAALIGDGAAAAVFESANGADSGLLAWSMGTFPSGSELAQLPGCGTVRHPNDPNTKPEDNLFRMRGPRLYKLAVHKVEAMVEELLTSAGLNASDIDLVVPHQPSGPGLEAMRKRLDFPPDRIVDVIGQYGNCIAASMPMALDHAAKAGRIKRGDKILMIGMGAGVSIAGAILRW